MLYSRPPNWNLKTGNGDAALRKVEQGIGFGHTVVPITVTGDGTVEAPIAASANPNSFEGKTIPEEPESMTTASAEVGPPTVGNVADVQVMESKAICHLLEATCTLELQHRIWVRSAGVLEHIMQLPADGARSLVFPCNTNPITSNGPKLQYRHSALCNFPVAFCLCRNGAHHEIWPLKTLASKHPGVVVPPGTGSGRASGVGVRLNEKM